MAQELQLYSVTLQRPASITSAAVGQFAGDRSQQVAVIRGSWLEILRPDREVGKLAPVLSYNCFAILRKVSAFRIAGSSKDYILLTSDSGQLVVLEYVPEKNSVNRLHCEPYGKTGIRRTVPGEYLVTDPKGRAALIASVEKNKLVYVLNRDSTAQVTIASPLEAHSARTLVYAMAGVDVGYENPTFASLETEYDTDGRMNDKMLVYYELDLGLNHVVRKWSDKVDFSANILFPVPGGPDGPSGVIIGAEGWIYYKHISGPTLRVPIPSRRDSVSPSYIVSGVMHKMKGAFFLLVQTNLGDLFKINVSHADSQAQELEIRYFDTIPVCSELCIFRSGFMLAVCEGGDTLFYQFDKLGDDDEQVYLSRNYDPEVKNEVDVKPAIFSPRPLDNIQVVDRLAGLSPLMSSDVVNTSGSITESPQIYTVSGKGPQSTFRSLSHGIQVEEIVSSELPAVPLAVWTTKTASDDEYGRYIVLSFANETLVLSIGESVEEVTDSGLLLSTQTLAVQQIGVSSVLQIYGGGMRLIDSAKNATEWNPPAGTEIVATSTNSYQVVIALNTSEIVYFEVDEDGQLNEYEEHKKIPGGVATLSLGDVPEGRLRSPLLAVGTVDSTVRILSVDVGSTLELLTVQALTAPPSDIRISHMKGPGSEPPVPYLHIGLNTGVYIMSILDPVTGQLSDTRTRFLGPSPIKLFQVTAGRSRDCILVLCTKPWLGYLSGSMSFEMAPLSYSAFSYAWGFSSEDCPEGIVGIRGSTLSIIAVDNLDEHLRQEVVPLRYTPRRMAKSNASPYFYVIESDNGTIPNSTSDDNALQFGDAAEQGRWASAIEVVDPMEHKVTHRVVLEDNEAAFSVCSCSFSSHNDTEYLVVGTSKDQVMLPKSSSGGFLHVYAFTDNGSKLEFIHKTPVEEAPLAMMEFQGRLLVGVGSTLRIYDIGLKQLLRKAQTKLSLSNITSLDSQGSRIVVGDIRESITYVAYKAAENLLIPFADDALPRHVTCATMLDYDTTMAGDRFGNVFVVRCPETVSQLADEDEHGIYIRNQDPSLNGSAANKIELLAHIFLQDTPTNLTRARLVPGGVEAVIYTGIQGTIGALIPFVSKQDVLFFQRLESLMRQEDASAAGRDHLVYRGYYVPVKNTIDGDLCERFSLLPSERQEVIANDLDRTVRDVERKIADMRIRSVF